jgi:phosphate butyryltransferase
MFRSFNEIERYIKEKEIVRRVVLVCAHDQDALSAVVRARKAGVIKPTLIGRETEILTLLSSMEETAVDYQIIHNDDETESAQLAVTMVREGKADIPMKGLMQTSTFMRAILDKETGLLPEGALLSQSTVLEHREKNRLMVISDCAVNIAPDLEAKIKITNNAIRLAQILGCEQPKVAAIAPVEVVNPKIPSTVDAKALADAAPGQIAYGVVDGPLGLDNAVSAEAAKHKGISGPVAGVADVLIMPNLDAGNVFTKTLTYFAGLLSAGTLNGTSSPVIMTSRTDTPENKFYSILVAILQSLEGLPCQ